MGHARPLEARARAVCRVRQCAAVAGRGWCEGPRERPARGHAQRSRSCARYHGLSGERHRGARERKAADRHCLGQYARGRRRHAHVCLRGLRGGHAGGSGGPLVRLAGLAHTRDAQGAGQRDRPRHRGGRHEAVAHRHGPAGPGLCGTQGCLCALPQDRRERRVASHLFRIRCRPGLLRGGARGS